MTRELLRKLVEDLREPLQQQGPLGMTLWQVVATPALILIALALGALFARVARAVLARAALSTVTLWDDKLARRLFGPLTLVGAIGILKLANPVLELSKNAEHLFNQLLRGGLYATLFWTCGRGIGVAGAVVTNSPWGLTHPVSRSLVPLGSRVARLMLFALALVVLLNELGVPVTSLLAGMGIGGLAIALAAQKTFENLLGAFSLGADQPFAAGDFVKVSDFVGTVERIGLRSTRFRTLDRTLITIPNGKLAEMQIESYTARDRFRLSTTLQLVYETTADQLRTVLENIEKMLRAHPKIWPEAVVVRFAQFGASSLDVELMCWFMVADYSEFQAVRQDVLIEILGIVQGAGSSFAYPTQTLKLAPGQLSLVPAGARDEATAADSAPEPASG